MSIDTKNIGALQAYQNSSNASFKHSQTTLGDTASAGNMQANTTTQANIDVNVASMTVRHQTQASLVAHLFNDQQNTQQSSLQLTYQSAIEALNERLMAENAPATENTEDGSQPAPTIEPISMQALKTQGGMDYWTPENTAQRIVSGATAFLGGFQKANPELEGEALMERYMEVVGGGLTQGFNEARDILGDLKVLKDDIAKNIDSTYDLVQNGMQAFKNNFLGLDSKDQSANDTPTQSNEQTEPQAKADNSTNKVDTLT